MQTIRLASWELEVSRFTQLHALARPMQDTIAANSMQLRNALVEVLTFPASFLGDQATRL